MVKGARQRERPRHLSTHTHTHWTLPTTMSVLETPFDIHVSSVYQTHTCMQAPIPTLCISAKKTHNKGSRTRPIMSTLMPRSGIPVICSRATLSCDRSYCISPWSGTPTQKCDLIFLLHSKSLKIKKCHKIWKISPLIKKLCQTMILPRCFACAREVIQNIKI